MDASKRGDFKPIANPYIVGNPIRDPGMFFGREDDFAYVKKKFSGGKEGGIIVLCGARRSGKTSVLFQILGGRLGEDFLPVLIDMQSMTITNDLDFLTKLAHEIVTAVDHADVTLDTSDAVWESNPFTAFENLIKKISDSMGDRKLVLMFDEYELFETHIDSGVISTHILNLLASLIEHRRVFVVFTGSDNLEARDKPYWSVFLSKALHRRISFLSHDDTLRLVTQPVGGMVSYGEAIPERIFTLTAGQPFYTQVLCQSLVDHLNDVRRSNVGAEDLQQVVSEIIENPLPQMIFSWNALADLEKLSLSIIAELMKESAGPASAKDIVAYAERENIGYRLDGNELSKCLENLFHHDVVTKKGGADAYRFKMDLWRFWVTRMHSVWQVVDEMERSEKGLPGKGILPEHLAGRRRKTVTVTVIVALLVVVPIGIWLLRRVGGEAPEVVPDLTAMDVTTRPAGANVFIDDAWIGVSPVTGREVPVGERVLRLELAGYRTVWDTLNCEKGEPQVLNYALTEVSGGLRVSSEPPGAAIHVDGQRTDLKTPAMLEGLSVNESHRIGLELAGFRMGVIEGIHVYEDSTIAAHHRFVKMDGALSIISQPAEAQVYLDGEYVGSTPCILDGVPFGQHGLRLTKAGYSGYSEDIEVSQANQKIEVSLPLLPPGRIVFNIEPYAALSINGELIREDVTFHEIELAPGRYSIVLEHPQLGTHVEDVELESDATVTIRHRFSD
jgi:hypothetical protein